MDKICDRHCRYYHVDHCDKRETIPETGLSCNFYKKRCERWKDIVDYAVRNISVGDEEETRLFETEEDIQDYLAGFKAEGIHPDIVDIIEVLLRKCLKWYTVGKEPREWNTIRLILLDLLKPYMSHRELYENNYPKWDYLFWRSRHQR